MEEFKPNITCEHDYASGFCDIVTCKHYFGYRHQARSAPEASSPEGPIPNSLPPAPVIKGVEAGEAEVLTNLNFVFRGGYLRGWKDGRRNMDPRPEVAFAKWKALHFPEGAGLEGRKEGGRPAMTCPYITTPDAREGTSYCRLAALNGDIHHAAQVAVSQWLQWREDAEGDDAPSVEWIEAMETLQARLREAQP